jgi:hypothetical protein
MKNELLELYVFTDTYDVPQLLHDALRAFMRTCADHSFALPRVLRVSRAFENLTPNSPMIRFIIDLYA